MNETYGALTQSEIREYTKLLGIDNIRFEQFVYCAQLLRWLQKVRKGNNIYYVAATKHAAIEYQFNAGVAYRDKSRWRTDIRAHWSKSDPSRLNAIGNVAAASLTK